ncbi:uncharacterized protein LOC114680155 isoform X2 [Macaca mulatta]
MMPTWKLHLLRVSRYMKRARSQTAGHARDGQRRSFRDGTSRTPGFQGLPRFPAIQGGAAETADGISRKHHSKGDTPAPTGMCPHHQMTRVLEATWQQKQLLLAPHYTRVPSSVPRGVASLLSQGCQPSKEETPHRKNTLNTARTRRTTRKLGVSIWAEGRAAPWNRSADLSRQEKKGHG